MAKLTGGRRILIDDFNSEDRQIAEKLAFVINPFLEQVNNGFQKQITVGDNLNMEFKEIAIEVDSVGQVTTTGSFSTTLGKITGIVPISNRVTSAAESLAISSISASNPTLVTTLTSHSLKAGQAVRIGNTDSDPLLDGVFSVNPVTDTTFEIQASITVPGTTGTIIPVSEYPTSAPFATFSQESNIVTIQHVTGLNPGITYNLILLIIGS